MSIELQKAMSEAWEKDRSTAVSRGRVDDAYELGFIAAWRTSNSKAPMVDLETAVVALAKRMAKNTEGTDSGYKAWIETMGRIFEAEAKACAEAWRLKWK